jgi:hypothetical protein
MPLAFGGQAPPPPTAPVVAAARGGRDLWNFSIRVEALQSGPRESEPGELPGSKLHPVPAIPST